MVSSHCSWQEQKRCRKCAMGFYSCGLRAARLLRGAHRTPPEKRSGSARDSGLRTRTQRLVKWEKTSLPWSVRGTGAGVRREQSRCEAHRLGPSDSDPTRPRDRPRRAERSAPRLALPVPRASPARQRTAKSSRRCLPRRAGTRRFLGGVAARPARSRRSRLRLVLRVSFLTGASSASRSR